MDPIGFVENICHQSWMLPSLFGDVLCKDVHQSAAEEDLTVPPSPTPSNYSVGANAGSEMEVRDIDSRASLDVNEILSLPEIENNRGFRSRVFSSTSSGVESSNSDANHYENGDIERLLFHDLLRMNPTHMVPPDYICNRCHIHGHWIQNCPWRWDHHGPTTYQGPNVSIGYFKCEKCGRSWRSEWAVANAGQNCLECREFIYPYRMIPKLSDEEKARQDRCNEDSGENAVKNVTRVSRSRQNSFSNSRLSQRKAIEKAILQNEINKSLAANNRVSSQADIQEGERFMAYLNEVANDFRLSSNSPGVDLVENLPYNMEDLFIGSPPNSELILGSPNVQNFSLVNNDGHVDALNICSQQNIPEEFRDENYKNTVMWKPCLQEMGPDANRHGSLMDFINNNGNVFPVGLTNLQELFSAQNSQPMIGEQEKELHDFCWTTAFQSEQDDGYISTTEFNGNVCSGDVSRQGAFSCPQEPQMDNAPVFCMYNDGEVVSSTPLWRPQDNNHHSKHIAVDNVPPTTTSWMPLNALYPGNESGENHAAANGYQGGPPTHHNIPNYQF